MTITELATYLDSAIKDVELFKKGKSAAETFLSEKVAEAGAVLAKVKADNEKALGIAARQYDDSLAKVVSLRKQLDEELDKVSGIPQTRVR